MDKVKITLEQEEALKQWKKISIPIEKKFNIFIEQRENWDGILKPLAEISVCDMAKILIGYYEVNEKFEVGDWVYLFKWDRYHEVEAIQDGRLYFMHDGMLDCEVMDEFEKVEEPWMVMLLNLRGEPVLKEGDRYVRNDGYAFLVQTDNQVIPDSFLDGRLEYFYPVESRIELNKSNK